MSFIEKAKKVHSNKYDYSLVEYKNNYTKLKILCPKHGLFLQTANSHLSGHGCPKCSKFFNNKDNLKDNFLRNAKKVHSNKYDYSLVNYVNNKTKIDIICPEHGIFKQEPRHHLSGCGCPSCSFISPPSSNKDMADGGFIVKSMKVHGNKYDYSLVDYTNSHTKVKLICPKHGVFEQTPSSNLAGNGCPKCSSFCSDTSIQHSRFLDNARLIHGNKYDYSLVDYVNSHSNVRIICNDHGEFLQTPTSHTAGHGCPSCPVVISSGHDQIINYIENTYDGEILVNDRKVIQPYELDIYLPDKSLAIEFNGLFWHSYDRKETKEEKLRHQNKSKMCANKNIGLFHIWENQWNDNCELIKSMISGKLGINNRIYARKCDVIELKIDDYAKFMNDNHLQGHIQSNLKLGLLYKNTVVCAIGINRSHKYEWEISRFASKLFTNVVGGFSKLMNRFVNEYNPKSIMSYANFDHSNGNLYEKNGFEFVYLTKPGYYYYKNKQVHSRQNFQKHKLKNKLDIFDDCKTESENMFNNGYRRLWNSGNIKYIKNFN